VGNHPLFFLAQKMQEMQWRIVPEDARDAKILITGKEYYE